jgi:hypothetical protein
MIEPGKRWGEHVRQRSAQCPAAAAPPYRTKSGTDVEQRRHSIVALLPHHQDGLTAREIREAIGLSRSLTDSALAGLFTRGVLHKRRNRYVLANQDIAREE